MANPLLLIDFDCNAVLGQSAEPTTWENTMKPVGVYNINGILLLNPNINPSGALIGPYPGRTAGGNSYGKIRTAHEATTNDSGYGLVGVQRSKYSIGSEVFVTLDIKYDLFNGGTYTSVQNLDNGCLFRWGQLRVNVKTVTYAAPTYTVVFNIYNGASVVATVTVPDVTASTWHYCKISAKLDAATGYISVNIDGYSQSVAYTGKNTVSSILLSSYGTTLTADFVYVGPPTFFALPGSGHPYPQLAVGLIDNVTMGTAGFPAGRVSARRWPIGASSVDTDWAAVGTSPTTVSDALDLPTDAKAARGTGVGANTLIDLAGSFDFTGMSEDVLGLNVYLKRPASRDSFVERHIAVGVSISGVHTMDTVVASEPLHIDNPVIPPNTNYTFGGLGGGVFTAGVTQTNFGNVKVRLLVS